MEILLNVDRIPKKLETTRKDFGEDIGHSSILKMKKNGMGRTLTSQKEDGTSKPIR